MVLLLPGAAAAQTTTGGPGSIVPSVTLPTIEVIGTSPLPGLGIDRDKVPSNTQVLTSADFDHDR